MSVIKVSRIIRNRTQTLSWVGYVPWERQEAYLSCTCGWRDRTFASEAKMLANIHNERCHQGIAIVRPED